MTLQYVDVAWAVKWMVSEMRVSEDMALRFDIPLAQRVR